MRNVTFGCDIGGVIVNKHPADGQIITEENYIEAPEVEHAIDILRVICDHFGPQRVIVIGRACTPKWSLGVGMWLAKHNFFERTGVLYATNLYMVKHYNQKMDICRARGVTHFLDDRLDSFDGDAPAGMYKWLLDSKDNPPENDDRYASVERMQNWPAVLDRLL